MTQPAVRKISTHSLMQQTGALETPAHYTAAAASHAFFFPFPRPRFFGAVAGAGSVEGC